MEKKFVIIFGVLIVLLLFAYLIDISVILFNGVPLNTYLRYLSIKIQYIGDQEARYFLEKCDVKNQTTQFIIKHGHVFSDVKEIYFNSSGEIICENFYVIDDCRDHCPYNKCIDDLSAVCKKIT